jgi:hypothetical protein
MYPKHFTPEHLLGIDDDLNELRQSFHAENLHIYHTIKDEDKRIEALKECRRRFGEKRKALLER